MDEKTDKLRDIFLSLSEEGTVTESQTADRGSLAADADTAEQRLLDLVARIREKFGFETDLSDDQRRELIERFYEGEDDATIADALGCEQGTVFEARLELRLLRRDEPRLPEEALAEIRDQPDVDAAILADSLDVDDDAVARARAIVAARDRSRRVSHRFRTAYEEILTDADLSSRFATDAREDGLEGATEGAETDVDF